MVRRRFPTVPDPDPLLPGDLCKIFPCWTLFLGDCLTVFFADGSLAEGSAEEEVGTEASGELELLPAPPAIAWLRMASRCALREARPLDSSPPAGLA